MPDNAIELKSVDWAIKLFRPLLRSLKLQEINNKPLTAFPSEYKMFHRYNMANCAIVVEIKKFRNEDDRGIFIWQYNEETNFYAFRIVLNNYLYTKSDRKTKILRKAAGIHEFTHCAAAMMTFSRLQSKILIETLQHRMIKKIQALNKVDLENLFRELTMSLSEKEKNNVMTFPDEHFRTDSEDFTGSYYELSRNFLLSYELFCEPDFFNAEKQKEFQTLLNAKKHQEALELLISVVKPLSEKKAISEHFIIQRIDEEFLNKLLRIKQ